MCVTGGIINRGYMFNIYLADIVFIVGSLTCRTEMVQIHSQ
jgi:hypothetical protein